MLFFLVDVYKVYPSLRGFQGRCNSLKYGHDDLPVVEFEDRSVPAGQWQPSSVPFVLPTQHNQSRHSTFLPYDRGLTINIHFKSYYFISRRGISFIYKQLLLKHGCLTINPQPGF